MSNLDEDLSIASIAISGTVSKNADFANSFIFNNLFAKNAYRTIKALTDDIKFARKRLVSPRTVYSGLFDVLQFEQVEPGNISSYKTALQGLEAWIGFEVSLNDLEGFARLAAELSMKRVVFAVRMETAEQMGANFMLENAASILTAAGIKYTLIKYAGDFSIRSEATFPYRIVRDALPLPQASAKNRFQSLSSDDIFRVLSEVVDIPKTFDSVYGIGPGTALDQEILIFMKSRGWPERVQIGLLMGDMMERIEKIVNDHNEKEEKAALPSAVSLENALLDQPAPQLPEEGKGNKYAGFFV